MGRRTINQFCCDRQIFSKLHPPLYFYTLSGIHTLASSIIVYIGILLCFEILCCMRDDLVCCQLMWYEIFKYVFLYIVSTMLRFEKDKSMLETMTFLLLKGIWYNKINMEDWRVWRRFQYTCYVECLMFRYVQECTLASSCDRVGKNSFVSYVCHLYVLFVHLLTFFLGMQLPPLWNRCTLWFVCDTSLPYA